MIQKAAGNDWKAKELSEKFEVEFGKYEIEMERYYEHGMCSYQINTWLCRAKANAKKIIVN